jgi:hypothetical protein
MGKKISSVSFKCGGKIGKTTVLLFGVALALGTVFSFFGTAIAASCQEKQSGGFMCCGPVSGKETCCTGSTVDEANTAFGGGGASCHEQTAAEKDEIQGAVSDAILDAQEIGGKKPMKIDLTVENPLTSKKMDKLVGGVIDFLFGMAVIVLPIIILVGGLIFATASGDPGKIEIGKRTVFWALAVLAIILLAKGVIILVRLLLGQPLQSSAFDVFG